MTTKRCPRCARTLDASQFTPDRHKGDGLASKCRACDRQMSREYYARNKAKANARTAADSARRYRANRAAALVIYWGRCAVCGSTEGLELDHVHGGGAAHRAIEAHRELYARIAATGHRLPDVELQLLCQPHHREKTMAETLRDDAGRFAGVIR